MATKKTKPATTSSNTTPSGPSGPAKPTAPVPADNLVEVATNDVLDRVATSGGKTSEAVRIAADGDPAASARLAALERARAARGNGGTDQSNRPVYQVQGRHRLTGTVAVVKTLKSRNAAEKFVAEYRDMLAAVFTELTVYRCKASLTYSENRVS